MTKKRRRSRTKRVSAQHANMRRKNESSVLSLLKHSPGLPSVDIARRIGLAPQTVSVVLKRLIDEGVLHKGEALRGRRGQPAVPISLNPEGAFSIGIEISWRHADVVLLNLTGNVLNHHHWEVPFHDGKTLVDDVFNAVSTCLDMLDADQLARLKGIGLAAPRRMGSLLHFVGGAEEDSKRLSKIDLAEALYNHFDIPVFEINDGIAACLGERAFARQEHSDNMLYLFIGTFLGAGLVFDGELLRSGQGETSSFGLTMVPDADGDVRGLHWIATVKALEDELAKTGKSVPRIRPVEWDWDAIEDSVNAWLRHAAHGLALAISNSCTVIYVNQTVIDGILPRPLMERLAQMVEDEIRELKILSFGQPDIVLGNLGEKAGAIGAAYAPLEVAIFAPEE